MKTFRVILALLWACAAADFATAQQAVPNVQTQVNTTPTLPGATRPDLVVTKLFAFKRVAGTNLVSFKVEITNKGVLPADLKGIVLQNYLSEDETLDPYDEPAGGGMLSTATLSLKGGESRTFNHDFVFDFSTIKPAEGDGPRKMQVNLGLVLDLHDKVDERDEDNNKTMQTVTVAY